MTITAEDSPQESCKPQVLVISVLTEGEKNSYIYSQVALGGIVISSLNDGIFQLQLGLQSGKYICAHQQNLN